MTFDIELRGEMVTISLSVNPPEPDVGIMGPYWDSETLRGEDGKVLNWDLTDEEIDLISDMVNDTYYAGEDYEDDE